MAQLLGVNALNMGAVADPAGTPLASAPYLIEKVHPLPRITAVSGVPEVIAVDPPLRLAYVGTTWPSLVG